jgi:hypothetical protein
VMPEDGRSQEEGGVYPFYGREKPRTSGARRWSDDEPHEGRRSERALSEAWKPFRELWDDLTREVAQERDRLQNAVLQAGHSFIQDMVRIAGQSLIDQLSRSGRSEESRQGQRRTGYG